MQRLSVVIANYNYEAYVTEAIESALGMAWDDLEVVVVDDGSTDGSLERIRAFGDRVTVVATENAGQRVAVNRGFAASSGDAVCFLDADDVLPTDLPAALLQVWGPEVSKVQVQMQRIDDAGAPIGRPFPAYTPAPSPAAVRRWVRATSAYPTPPGSGNVYARWFLEQVLPVGPEVGEAADSALLAAAPFLGDVVTVPGVTVGYRRHDANDSNLLVDPGRFPREVERARDRWRFARSMDGVVRGDGPLFRSRELLQLRVAAHRMVPQARPLPDDGTMSLLRDIARSPFQPGPEGIRRRVTIAAWSLLTLLTPEPVSRRLISIRYAR